MGEGVWGRGAGRQNSVKVSCIYIQEMAVKFYDDFPNMPQAQELAAAWMVPL